MNENTQHQQTKQLVKERYGVIAQNSKIENASSCCGATGCSTIDNAILSEDYSQLHGYVSDADLGLGCGLPTEFAFIKKGDTVIDLGSGAGNDCFVARSLTGSEGKVIGIDFTEKMIEKARSNALKLGYTNVEFRLGDIENMPVEKNTADVVVSNCVLNLVPDKKKAFEQMYNVLKEGGHFSISDVVLDGLLPDGLETVAEMYVGCIAGAIQLKDYLRQLEAVGFTSVRIQKEKVITIPNDVLAPYMSQAEIDIFRKSGTRILSVTVYGEKNRPESSKKVNKTGEEACCEPGCCGN